VRHYSGGIQIEAMGDNGTDTMSLEGFGQIKEGTCAGGTVSVRGNIHLGTAITNLTLDEKARVASDNTSEPVTANVIEISDDSTAADRLEALLDGVLICQVNDAAATTTAFAADGFTEATDNHFSGRLITFITGDLAGQQTDITGYDAAGGAQGPQELTVTALTEAPGNNDYFVIH
jgi:hypothetical protein